MQLGGRYRLAVYSVCPVLETQIFCFRLKKGVVVEIALKQETLLVNQEILKPFSSRKWGKEDGREGERQKGWNKGSGSLSLEVLCPEYLTLVIECFSIKYIVSTDI